MALRRRRSHAARAYAGAPLPSLDTPWRRADYAVVDLETTGLDPRRDEIISFACVPVRGGRALIGAAAKTEVRPGRMPGADTIRIHGLRESDLLAAPKPERALETMLEALSGRILVAHAAWVETGFLSTALRRARLKLRGPVLDTAVLAQRVPEGAAAVGERAVAPADSLPGLSRAAWALNLPVHRPHHADGDALTTAQLFIAVAAQLEAVEPQTVGSLAELSKADRRYERGR
ncbi:MAG: 3'-5' exonuclease [Actinobacteria bacterium]|nr:3'-5' exonuclease [Actinomycetota bacterium]